MAIDMSITLDKRDVRTINQFITKFPNVIDKATGKTAQRGTVVIVKKTPRLFGDARRSWGFKRLQKFVWLIFSSLQRIVFLEEGTGIHGPKRRVIKPKKAKMLRWVDPKTGDVIWAKQVRGIRPVAMVKNSISLITKILVQEIKNRIAKEWSRRV
jgi:hypothetical protein